MIDRAKSMTTAEILREIEAHQNAQKRNPWGSRVWQEASRKLAPLFAEMARRTAE